MAAHSANIRGASQTFVVDVQPDRLALAEKLGVAGQALQPVVAGSDHPGQAHSSEIISHQLSLDEAAPKAYDRFDKRVDGWTKVLLHPAA